MITIAQIKAARALLGWTQHQLAVEASLSLPAVNNIERNLVSPRQETLQAICEALMGGGVEFIEQSGVRLRPPELNIKIIQGEDWLKKYDEFFMSVVNNPKQEVLKFSCDEELWMVYGSTTNHLYFEYRDRLNFNERIIVPKSQQFLTNARVFYRYHNDSLFGKVTWQVFGDCVAYILWPEQQIIVKCSKILADAQRAIFNMLWKDAQPFSDAQWKKLKKWEAHDRKA